MSFFIDNACNAIQKELGEKVSHQPKHTLGKGADAALKFDTSEFSQTYKASMDRLAMKLEIIGSNIIELKKHKNRTNKSIASLEVLCEKFLLKDDFNNEFSKFEERMREFVKH